MAQLINQLFNDEAVYRTAPATQGLVIRHTSIYCNTAIEVQEINQLGMPGPV